MALDTLPSQELLELSALYVFQDESTQDVLLVTQVDDHYVSLMKANCAQNERSALCQTVEQVQASLVVNDGVTIAPALFNALLGQGLLTSHPQLHVNRTFVITDDRYSKRWTVLSRSNGVYTLSSSTEAASAAVPLQNEMDVVQMNQKNTVTLTDTLFYQLLKRQIGILRATALDGQDLLTGIGEARETTHVRVTAAIAIPQASSHHDTLDLPIDTLRQGNEAMDRILTLLRSVYLVWTDANVRALSQALRALPVQVRDFSDRFDSDKIRSIRHAYEGIRVIPLSENARKVAGALQKAFGFR